MAKQFARQFYSSKQWQDCRNEYAKKRHHLCECCLSKGIYKGGVIVHHKIELTPTNINDPSITLSHDNLELLCRECHADKHELSGGRWAEVNKRRKKEKINRKRYIVGDGGAIICKT